MTTADAILLAMLAALPLLLTLAMFLSRNPMLGFPCGLFWMLLGAHAYSLSSTTWDIYYGLFFASALGMTIFTILAAYGLRERKDTEVDVKEDEGYDLDKGFYDEEHDEHGRRLKRQRWAGGWAEGVETGHREEQDEPDKSRPSRAIEARADRRRSGKVVKRTNWGEFK